MTNETSDDPGVSLRGLAQYRRKYAFTLIRRKEEGARVFVVSPASVPDDDKEMSRDELRDKLQDKARRVTRFEEWEVVETVTGERIGLLYRSDVAPGGQIVGIGGQTVTVGPNDGPYFADENTLSGNRRVRPFAISGPTVWVAAERMWKSCRPVKSIVWRVLSGGVHLVDWIVAAFKLGLVVFGIVLAVLSASTVWEIRHQLAERVDSWLGVQPPKFHEKESNAD